MTVKHWIFLILVILNALIYVWQIGKPRKSVTHGDAIFSLAEWSFIVWLALS